MKKTTTRLIALVLSLALLLTSCGGGASATSMHLRKTEGTVGVSDGEGKELTPKENLGLYSGYQVGTQAESYAWIDLDKVKLTKLDAESEAEISKDGKNLEINVKSGSLFFNVTEPLEDDESLNIHTSTMVIGVRGTCGWVTENTAALLEGTVSVTAGDQEVTVNAGEMAVLTAEGTLEVKDLTPSDVPAFVREEIAEDEDLAADIQDTTGIDLTGADPMAPYEELLSKKKDVVYSEIIDFEGDGSPELFLFRLIDGRIHNFIWQYDGEGYTQLKSVMMWGDGTESSGSKITLVESGGMLCLQSHIFGNTMDQNGQIHHQIEDVFYGFTAVGGSWEQLDRVGMIDGIGPLRLYDNGTYIGCGTEEYKGVLGKYTHVRDIVSYDGTNMTVVQ